MPAPQHGTFQRNSNATSSVQASTLNLISRSLRLEEGVNVCILMLFALNGLLPFVANSAIHRLTQFSIGLFWASAAIPFFTNKGRILWNLWTVRLVAIYLFWGFLSAAWNPAPLTTIYSPILSCLCVFFYFNYVLDRFSPAEFTRLLVWTFTILFLLSIFFVFLMPGQGLEDLADGNPANIGAWRGAFEQKNHLGEATALGFAICIGLQPKTGFERIWRGGLLLLTIALEIGSRSREAWVASIVVFGLSIIVKLTRRFEPQSRFPLLLGVGSMTTLISVIAYENLDAILTLFGRDRTLTGRSTIWEGTLLLIGRRPWLGYGTYGVWDSPRSWDVVVRTSFVATSAHNAYLDIIVSYGIIGFLLFLPIPVASILFVIRSIVSYSLADFEIYIYLIAAVMTLSFGMSILTLLPGIGLVLLVFSVANLEKVERSGLMSLRTQRS